MASPAYNIPSTSDYETYYSDSADASSQQQSFNNTVMVIAIVVLFCVILLITSLHIFSKWAWRSGNQNSSNRVHFFQQDHAHGEDRSLGLSKDAIAQLPTFTYKALVSNDLEAGENAGSPECAVCLSEFQEDEKGRLLPSCKHSFHIECIDMWFYSHSTCPLCRAVVMPTITTSPLLPITISAHEHQQGAEELASTQGAQNVIEAMSSTHRSNPLNTMAISVHDNAANMTHIPTNILFSGDAIQFIPSQVGSSQSLEKPLQPSSTSRATRRVPHITIEIPAMQDSNLTSPSCISLPSRTSQLTSPYEAAYSSAKSLKSPGLRESVKRILSMQSSKEKRALPSSSQGANMDSPKGCS